MRPKPEPLPSTVRQVGWISFFGDICSEMVYPVIPLFLRGVLQAPASALGLIEGVSESLVSFLKGVSGFRSDASGKRLPYVHWGYTLSAIGKPLLALAYSWPMVLVARSVDRFGKGIRTTARDALIADAVPKERLGHAFGFHRAMDTSGALVGVLLGLLLVALLPDRLRLIFLIAAIPGFVAAALTLRLRELPHGVDEGAIARTSIRELPKGYWLAFALSMLFAIGNTSDMFLMARAGDVGFTPVMVIAAYALYNFVYALLSVPLGRLSDRIGRWPVVGAGWAIYALVYAGFAFMGPGLLWPLFALYGVYIAAAEGAGKALVASFSPPNMRGTALGFFFMCVGFATLGGNLAAGALWDRFGASYAFAFSAAIAGIATLLIPIVVLRRPTSASGSS